MAIKNDWSVGVLEWWSNGPLHHAVLQCSSTPFRSVFSVMDLTNLHSISATEAARLIRDGVISSEQFVEACLARITGVDGQIQAWAFLDPEYVLQQARAADQRRLSGATVGPLHGVPVAIKDIFDTADMPTEYGSPIYAGRTPSRDASVVTMLRAAGAVIMGKTVTTEFAYFCTR